MSVEQIETAGSPAATTNKHTKTPSRSISLRVLPSKLRPKTTEARSRDPGQERFGSTLAPPIPQSPRIRRSSAPEEGAQTPEWRANQFTSPLESDAEFVRRTYAHFSIAGVPDDGFSDGKEYTREKSGLPAWEEDVLSRPGSTVVVSTAPTSSGQHAESSTTAVVNGVNGRPAQSRPQLTSSRSAKSVVSQRSVQPVRHDTNSNGDAPNPPVSVFNSAETALSTGTFLSTNERQRRQEVAEQRRQELLAHVDRYGFFSESPSNAHHKATLLPSSLFSAPFPKKGSKNITSQQAPLPSSLMANNTPSNGNGNGNGSSQIHKKAPAVHEARAAADTAHRQREQERIAKWARMLTVKGRDSGHNAVRFDFTNGFDRKVRRRVYKGIPDSWRSAAWSALLHYRQQTPEGRQSYTLAKPHLQTATASITEPDVTTSFERLQATPSTYDVQIDLDVPRTISGHIQFHTRYGQGQRALFHVLHAVSMLCDQCGYCQGMGPIAATLLCYFSPERAYAAMAGMHNVLNLHSTFSPGFPGLVENLYVQDQLLRKYMPQMAAVLDEQGVVASAYATKWFITLFSNSIPFETQLRVWDAWLLDGQDVISLVAVAIIWAHRGIVLRERADFETILSALSCFFVPEDDDALLFWVREALGRRDVRGTMASARQEYRRKVEAGEASALML
ncbi:hypothetical protein EX895_001674 [Sporisorium graminicola]|uniref:Rab-GAP TBC domain-containing protein n=1 Tax=Sporisorium graminicola TaxID=280036 RepID=A0A4U7KWW5_9BASI|nr:hypothetical protein EX895_001674 [Sporisorium graminicola]TKY89143.1 hypothetical protein EX895_001674 [Sporisorium graminicola]